MSTFVTCTANSTAIAFKSFDELGPRYYKDLVHSGPQYDIKRKRAPGWNGNAIIRGGFTGERLVLIVRYQDTLANAFAAWKSDKQLFAEYNTSINDGVYTWERCTMLSSERITEELAYGAGTTKFFEVRYVFEVEEQY